MRRSWVGVASSVSTSIVVVRTYRIERKPAAEAGGSGWAGRASAHTILVANGTIRRNAHIQPPVRSIIIHVDMIFCVKGTGRDSKGWPTIEYAMIDTTALRAK